MGERRGTKGLELWCRRMTEGYPGVSVTNMTTSWRDGLAFCAIIHHFRPDLIEFSKLNKDDIYRNNELAFTVAERHLGIPALLEPEDMVEYEVPDRLCILTYLSQFYQAFAVGQGKSPSRTAPKRPASSPDHGIVSPASTSPPTKAAFPVVGKIRREPCAKCSLPVFIAERLNVGKLLYHRTCFRCARCDSQLTLANYYETENHEFCCETCPDEEKPRFEVLTRSLSDEEKTATLERVDPYSSNFETALEFPEDESLRKNFTLSSFDRARSVFMTAQFVDTASDESVVVPDVRESRPPVGDGGFSKPLGTFDSDSVKDYVVTKDAAELDDEGSSVKARMRIFETKTDDVVVPSEISNIDEPSHSSGISSGDVVERLHSSETSNVDIGEPSHGSEGAIGISNDDVVERLHSSEIYNIDIGEPSHSSEDSIGISNDDVVERLHSSEISNRDIGEPSHSSEDASGISNSDVVERLHSSEISNSEEFTSSEDHIEDNSVIIVLGSSDESDTPITSSECIIIEDSSEESPDRSVAIQLIPPKVQEEDRNEREIRLIPAKQQEEDRNEREIRLIAPKQQEEDRNVKEEIILIPPKQQETEGEILPPPEEKDYPDDLNPFGEDDEQDSRLDSSTVSLNPFGDDDDEDELSTRDTVPTPKPRKRILLSTPNKRVSGVYIKRISLNPFEDEEEEEEEKKSVTPQPAERKLIKAPKVSLTPLWIQEDETSGGATPEPKPRDSGLSISSSSTYSSSNSVSSSQSRKKKPAPKPPSLMVEGASGPSSLTSSPSHSVAHSPKATPIARKAKKAPPPPTSTPYPNASQIQMPVDLSPFDNDLEKDKIVKDEANRIVQNTAQSPTSSSENSTSPNVPNKSTFGKWKRQKGQAPSRPMAKRRTIKSLPMVEIRRELELIEIQQQGLEKQGVRLEQIIRERSEGPSATPDDTLAPEVEDMVLQLFELVNEKNELFRKQAELMYLRRQQRLEEEHADVEYQIRCLMLQPEANKTDSDKAKEEELINRLVDIVERRNEIIECLEMDRVREAEEDDSINNQLNLFASKKEEVKPSDEKVKKKKPKKEKKFKIRGHKVDDDKDIDESEASPVKVKDKKKKKFNLF